jgi:hypothetical protein
MPAAREGRTRDAAPEPFAVALPREVAPSKKVIVPVGTPEAAVTVAVRVTAWAVVAGLGETISDVAVEVGAGALTVSARLVETDALKLVVPA